MQYEGIIFLTKLKQNLELSFFWILNKFLNEKLKKNYDIFDDQQNDQFEKYESELNYTGVYWGWYVFTSLVPCYKPVPSFPLWGLFFWLFHQNNVLLIWQIPGAPKNLFHPLPSALISKLFHKEWKKKNLWSFFLLQKIQCKEIIKICQNWHYR